MEGFLNPAEILNKLGLQKSMIAADFGCGSGGWAIPLAEILEEGKVYAIDILKGPLSALESRARLARILNIQTMVSDIEKSTKLISGTCDLILMTNLLFQCEDKKAVLEEGKRALKPGGKILVVDWEKSSSFGPREEAVLKEDIKKIGGGLGLKIDKEFDASPYHWGLVLAKPG